MICSFTVEVCLGLGAWAVGSTSGLRNRMSQSSCSRSTPPPATLQACYPSEPASSEELFPSMGTCLKFRFLDSRPKAFYVSLELAGESRSLFFRNSPKAAKP